MGDGCQLTLGRRLGQALPAQVVAVEKGVLQEAETVERKGRTF